MNEQFKGEKGPTPESLVEQKYKEMRAAEDEVEQIMKEIENVLANTPDRVEAEKIVLEKYAPLEDEAMKKSREALNAWSDAIRESGERDKKELDDMEKNLGGE